MSQRNISGTEAGSICEPSSGVGGGFVSGNRRLADINSSSRSGDLGAV